VCAALRPINISVYSFNIKMSDQDLKKPGVPSWQLKAKDEGKEDEGNEEAESPAPQDIPASRESIIDKARRFLQEDEVKNSTTEKKIAFLEEKGLNNEEIANLLGAVTNREASTQVSQVDVVDQSDLIIAAYTICARGNSAATSNNFNDHLECRTSRPNARCTSYNYVSRIPDHSNTTGATDHGAATDADSLHIRRHFGSALRNDEVSGSANGRIVDIFTARIGRDRSNEPG
jgi:hypothetical protein